MLNFATHQQGSVTLNKSKNHLFTPCSSFIKYLSINKFVDKTESANRLEMELENSTTHIFLIYLHINCRSVALGWSSTQFFQTGSYRPINLTCGFIQHQIDISSNF